MKIGLAFGRFNPLTIEHEKLLNGLENGDYDRRYVFIFGKNEKVLPIEEREFYVRSFHPFVTTWNTKDSSILGIPHALKWIDYTYPNSEITVHGGVGNLGLTSKTDQGGSISEVQRILSRGSKDTLSFTKVSYVRCERGIVSGTFVRQHARLFDANNPQHVLTFKRLVHSNFSNQELVYMMRKYQAEA